MEKFKKYLDELQTMDVGEIIADEPLYKHTTFKVGGPAKIFINVKDNDALITIIKYCRKRKIKLLIIGRGSNLLISDKAFEGIVISLNKTYSSYRVNGSEVTADAGVSMIKLAYECAKIGLSGFEFMGGIPGNIGGGIYMNAGAYKHEICELVESVTILDDQLKIKTLSKEDMQFTYRHSIIQDNPKWIILNAKFILEPKDPKEIQQLLDKRKEKRMATQPWNMPSCGSVFRNPKDGNAWQLIDEAGLRGYEIGGAQVSPKHSNFIVNNGYASAKDIYELIDLVHKTVKKKFKVDLKKEVCFINWE